MARDQFEDYLRVLDQYKLEHAEVSDGSIEIPSDEKCEYIRRLATRVKVLSEVGSKDAEKIFNKVLKTIENIKGNSNNKFDINELDPISVQFGNTEEEY